MNQEPIAQGLGALAKYLRVSKPVDMGVEDAWRNGNLAYKMWPVQRQMAEVLTSPDIEARTRILNCARRIRKTTTVLIKCIEKLVTQDCAPVRYIAPTQKMLRKIAHPIVRLICADMPEDMRPRWNSQDSFYLFPSTGMELHLAGSNNGHEDDSRGTASSLCVIDEAQMIVNLKYLVSDVLMPQLLSTNGMLWMVFTPPKTPMHDTYEYAQIAKLKKAYAEFNIYESEYEKDIIKEFCVEAGGEDSTTWKREYMCQFVVDTNFSIIPEWDKKYECEYMKDEYYKFYSHYVGMDIGVRDLTVLLYGTYDFKQATLYIEDESFLNGPQMTTEKVAEMVKNKEKLLWGNTKPKLRVSDNNNLILLNDLSILHQTHFIPTNKDTLEAMVNKIRLWVSRGRIKVHPRCEQLIGCLRYAVWDDHHKDWERSSAYGHFDALAALMYLVRNIDEHSNPIPMNYNFNPANQHIPKEILIGTSTNARNIEKALLGHTKHDRQR